MSSELIQKFNQKVNQVKTLVKTPTNKEKLQLYAWFKQAKFGDCVKDRPSMFYFTECAKYDAWLEKKGKTKDEAMKEYIALVDKLVEAYGKDYFFLHKYFYLFKILWQL